MVTITAKFQATAKYGDAEGNPRGKFFGQTGSKESNVSITLTKAAAEALGLSGDASDEVVVTIVKA